MNNYPNNYPLVTNNYPLVTICLLTHNAERFLSKTLNSLLAQTYPNFEILVSDNYSDDQTLEIVKSFQAQNSKIIFRQNPKPLERDEDYIGCYYNYNSCLNSGLIKGEFVAFCHDDDIYEKDYLKKEVETLISHPEIGAVFTTVAMIDQNDKKIGRLGLPKELRKKQVFVFGEVFEILLKRGNTFLQTPTFMARKKIFEKVGLFNEKSFRTSADLEMWLKILKKYPIGIINDDLIRWRKTGGGGTAYQHLCTKQADFFKVMDYYLNFKILNFKPRKKLLRQYEYQKRFNETLRAMNFLIKGEKEKAKELLKKPFPYSRFLAFWQNINSKKIKGAVLRLLMNIAILFGLSRPLAKILYKLRYS